MKLSKIALVVGAFVAMNAAHATGFNNSTGLTGTFSTETFNSPAVATDTPAGNLFAGLTFDANIKVSNSYNGSFANQSGAVLTNFFPCCTAVTSFTFSQIVSSAAFAFVTNPGTSTFIAKLGGTTVDSFTAPTSTSGSVNFYGFTGVIFNSIEIHSGGSNNAYALDNLQSVTAVPEPESYAMLLAGLGLMGAVARRRKAKQA